MKTITETQYNKIHRDFRGVYSSDNIHGTNWNGRRTMLDNDNGATVLLIEGVGFKIVPDTIYIYEEPFNGRILNTMHNEEVDYTGEERRSRHITENGVEQITIYFVNKLNLAQYIEQNKLDPDKIKTATSEEIDLLFQQHEENERTDWEEITEERFDEMLNVLPPVRWTKIGNGGSFFFISEAYSGSNHSCFANLNGKYYESLRSIKESTHGIYKSIREITTEVAAS